MKVHMDCILKQNSSVNDFDESITEPRVYMIMQYNTYKANPIQKPHAINDDSMWRLDGSAAACALN